MSRTNAVEYFLDSAARFPDRPALWVDGETYSYRRMASHVETIADRLRAIDGAVCATIADRSLTAYCAPLACMLAGKIHVPLGNSFPEARMAGILERTRPAILICDQAGQAYLPGLVARLDVPMQVLPPESDAGESTTGSEAPNRHGDRKATSLDRDAAATASGLPVPDAGIAYVLFTSGSTGQPKGVAVGHTALCAYVDAVLARYPQLDEHQRCTQLFEPTFDLSMHDMFVTWAAGACLYCVPKAALLMPTAFVNEHLLTVWFSVPSLAATLQRFKLLEPGALPTLTLALFCGEALPGPLAKAWMAAAPNARCENLYGPTEATIACMAYRVRAPDGARTVVPIGAAFPAMEIAVVREDRSRCAPGEAGELWLGGPQLAAGYWQDPAQTDARFVGARLAGLDASRWYRTGDLAMIDPEGTALFLGRADRQVKLRGYRVELQEIEAHLRAVCSAPDSPAEVAVVAISAPGEAASGIAAFVVCARFETRQALAAMKLRLPSYMVPSEIHTLDALPLNSNGKVDYPALSTLQRSLAPAPRTRRNAAVAGTTEA